MSLKNQQQPHSLSINQLSELTTIDLHGRIVLLRCDLNVPVDQHKVTDDERLRRVVPTIKFLMEKGAKTVLCSHLGRPSCRNPDLSLEKVVKPLSVLIGNSIKFCPDTVGPGVTAAKESLNPGEVLLIENLRFDKREKSNDPDFAKLLADSCDLFVNDAFSCAHRAHASTSAITDLLPSYAGHSLVAELQALAIALEHPQRPVVGVIGGAKISSKITVLQNLLPQLDTAIIGGAMANTFLAAQGFSVGQSLFEESAIADASRIMQMAKDLNCNLILPIDCVTASSLSRSDHTQLVEVAQIPHDQMVLDIGQRSIEQAITAIKHSKTVLWNGPLGAFENPVFAQGTKAVAQFVTSQTQNGALCSVAGGGDTFAALRAVGLHDKFSYVSAAGGAFLEWLEGKTLPGIAALKAARENN